MYVSLVELLLVGLLRDLRGATSGFGAAQTREEGTL